MNKWDLFIDKRVIFVANEFTWIGTYKGVNSFGFYEFYDTKFLTMDGSGDKMGYQEFKKVTRMELTTEEFDKIKPTFANKDTIDEKELSSFINKKVIFCDAGGYLYVGMVVSTCKTYKGYSISFKECFKLNGYYLGDAWKIKQDEVINYVSCNLNELLSIELFEEWEGANYMMVDDEYEYNEEKYFKAHDYCLNKNDDSKEPHDYASLVGRQVVAYKDSKVWIGIYGGKAPDGWHTIYDCSLPFTEGRPNFWCEEYEMKKRKFTPDYIIELHKDYMNKEQEETEDKPYTTLDVRMSESLKEEIENLSDKWGLSMSEAAMFMIKYYVDYELEDDN